LVRRALLLKKSGGSTLQPHALNVLLRGNPIKIGCRVSPSISVVSRNETLWRISSLSINCPEESGLMPSSAL